MTLLLLLLTLDYNYKPCCIISEGADMCVTSESTCPPGSELRVVGRHGKPECVQRKQKHQIINTVRMST